MQSPKEDSADSVVTTSGDSVPLWKELQVEQHKSLIQQANLHLKTFRLFSLDSATLRKILSRAANEKSWHEGNRTIELSLPKPSGGFERFSIFETTTMDSALAAAYPQLKTYGGQGIEQPAAMVRLEFNSNGFHSYVQDFEGEWFIQPLLQNYTHQFLISFYKRDILEKKQPFELPDSMHRQ